ncbi:MAG TPA: SpoIIE family protein phosphatase [Candidatus Limnocylindria bacterium]|nr:SpoIIE family protein phosphatase [Candidatus Limnocylindria bacterium]
MTPWVALVVWVETFVVLAVAWRFARRARPPERVPGRRPIAIAGLLVAQAALLYGVVVLLLPAIWRDGDTGIRGLAWLTQALRAALLLYAFTLWYGIARSDLAAGRRRVLLVLALLAQAFSGGAVPLLGAIALVWLATRTTWTRELGGWRRLTALILSPFLFLVVMLLPYASVVDGRLAIRIVAFADPWQAALFQGTLPPALQMELAMARPLDRVIQALLDLFRAQLAVLALRALTMPMRLSGMSLKRRFSVNYLFVRVIPSFLGLITVTLVGYFAFGLHKAAQVRAELDRTLAQTGAAGAALLDDPRALNGGPEAARRLEAARAWLGADGSRAHFVVRRWDAQAAADAARRDSAAADTAVTAGTAPGSRAAADSAATGTDSVTAEPAMAVTPNVPASVLAMTLPSTADHRVEGMIEDGRSIYLVSRRTSETPSPGRSVEIYVPLDSIQLGAIAKRVGAHVAVTLNRGVSVVEDGISFVPDSTGKPRVSARSPSASPKGGLFLARSFLPLGDWRSGWNLGRSGAVALELTTTQWMLIRSLADVPAWLFSNVFMIGLLFAVGALVGITEGIAVRSGRGIVEAVEQEVDVLRAAAARYGTGDLSHRVPVRGSNEFSVLAGSFNDMASSLERQRAELIEKERLEEDLEVAREIQRRFLPQRAPAVPGLVVAGVSVPSREVGGDLFHYVELAGNRLGIALGDVSGKSVPAALIMSNVMSALRTEALHETEIEKSLERLNRLIVEQIEPGRFVTLFYGIVDPGAGLLRYTSAGHNPVLRISGDEVHWLGEGGVPLGVLPEARYPVTEVPFRPGDVVVAYSDGVTEAEGPGAGGEIELFGEERLADTVGSLRSEPVEAIVRGVLAAVERFAAGRPQADDITLVVVRHV